MDTVFGIFRGRAQPSTVNRTAASRRRFSAWTLAYARIWTAASALLLALAPSTGPAQTAPPPPSGRQALKDAYGGSGNEDAIKVGTNVVSPWFGRAFLQNQFYVVFFIERHLQPDGKFDDCHACEASVGAASYTFDRGVWRLLGKQSSFASLGSYGDLPPKPRVSSFSLGIGRLGVMVELSDAHQGIEQTFGEVLAFGRHGWEAAGTLDLAGNNAGACEEDPQKRAREGGAACWSFTSTVTPQDASEMPPLLVARKGTVAGGARGVDKAKDTKYVFANGAYSEVGSPAASSAAAAARRPQFNEEAQKRIFDKTYVEAAICMGDATKIFLIQGMRDEARIAQAVEKMCGQGLISVMVKFMSTPKGVAAAFVHAMAIDETHRKLGR